MKTSRLPIGKTSTLALALVLAACASDDGREAPAQRASCESHPGGSRWASATAYRETAAFGRDEADWLGEAGGIALHDSLVFVYDAPEARVLVLTARLQHVRTFGRRGGGPGELNPFTSRGLQGPQWQWLATAGDTLLVFDGLAVHRFAADGRFLGRAYREPIRRTDLNDGSPIVSLAGGELLSSWGGYYLSALRKPAERYRWSILRHGARGSDTLLSLQLAPLPEGRSGVGFNGPAQARPVWAVSQNCVVATDGGGGWLVRGDLSGRGLDTVRFDLPKVVPPRIDEAEVARLSGMATKGRDGGYLGPSLERRISAIAVDPDGYAWILPTQDSTHAGPGVEVVRVALATGQAERDTVPAFPVVFGAPGVFYARTNDPISGVAEVVRYDALPPAPR